MKERLTTFNNEFASASISVENSKLQAILKSLVRARKEFDSTRFMVLIVGPVKSGKSTLVNIFARNYVSPTAYEECTARPCIIAKVSKGCIIRQYKSFGVSGDDKIKAFDVIIDNLRGIADEQEVTELATWKDFPLTEENITRNLKINPLHLDKQSFESEPLITLLEVHGGNFINDEIVLIDMPGLDGYTVNHFESDTYKRMAERADFVIFVQSTSSVINDSSKKFLDHLYGPKSKRRPPMCLIHNIHEYDYWRYETESEPEKAAESENPNRTEERDANIRKQIEIGINRITALIGRKDDEEIRVKSVNLGKVNDYLFNVKFLPKFKNILSEEFHSFEQYETNLYEYLTTKQRVIREKNSIDGARGASEKAYADFNEIKREINKRLDEINTILDVLNNIPSEIINYGTSYRAGSISAEIREEAQHDMNLKNWESRVISAKKDFVPKHIPGLGILKAQTVYSELDRLADSLSRKSGASKGSTLHNSTIEKFKKHWEEQFIRLKSKIEQQLSECKIQFVFPYFDFASFAPCIDDVFKNNDIKGWAGTNAAFTGRLNTQYYRFKSEITQEIRLNDFLRIIPDTFIGMCKEYANKVIESFKETRAGYTNPESTGILDKEKSRLQNDLDLIDKMLAFIPKNLLP